jgi:Zn finger protein HypA/HybF involved in hydrogenase expression
MSIEHNWQLNMSTPAEYSCPSCQQFSTGTEWRQAEERCPKCGSAYDAVANELRDAIVSKMKNKEKK